MFRQGPVLFFKAVFGSVTRLSFLFFIDIDNRLDIFFDNFFAFFFELFFNGFF